MTAKLQLYDHQVSGKAPKFTDKQQRYIYKTFSQPQGKFYQYLNSKDTTHRSYGLRKYIPQFLGIFSQKQILSGYANESSNIIVQTLLFADQISLAENEQIQENFQSQKNIKSKRQQWVQHISSRVQIQQNQLFLKLKNLTYRFQYPNIIDIKLGIKKAFKNKKKLENSTTFSHKFRINGLSVKQFDLNSQGQQKFMSKYYCQKINAKQMTQHLAFFFFDGQQIHFSLIKKVIRELKQMILAFKSFLGLRFMSSSIFIAYDAFNPQKYTINFIDFDKYQNCLDLDSTVQQGMINTLYFLNKIIENQQSVCQTLMKKQIRFYKEIEQVVPQYAIKKYNTKILQNS